MSEGDLSDQGISALRAANAKPSASSSAAATAATSAAVATSATGGSEAQPTAGLTSTPNSKQRPVRRRLRKSTTVTFIKIIYFLKIIYFYKNDEIDGRAVNNPPRMAPQFASLYERNSWL
jgi:hypothetical protein